MSTYPIVLTGPIRAVVIGGGQVAERKVNGLLQAGADITVISPRLSPTLGQLAQQGRIRVVSRSYLPGDLAEARLAIAATDGPEVNAAVWQEASQRGCLVNVVDDPQRCTFHVPAVVRRGEITIGISTAGGSPALARHLRCELDALIGPEYGQLAEILAELRSRLRARVSPERETALPWNRLIEEALSLLKAGQVQEVREIVNRFGNETV